MSKFALATLITVVGCCMSGAQDTPRPPAKLAISRNRAPEPVVGFGYHIAQGELVIDDNKCESLEDFDVKYQLFPKYPEFNSGKNSVRYPFVRKNDIVPVFGELYRAMSIGHESVTLERLDKEAYPKGIGFAPDSIPLMFNRLAHRDRAELNHQTLLNGTTLFLDAITAQPGVEVSARLRVYVGWKRQSLVVDNAESDGYTVEANVKVGDFLALKKVLRFTLRLTEEVYAYEVRAIVPPNDEAGIGGWVELGVKPHSVAELAKQKKNIVWPAFPATKPDPKRLPSAMLAMPFREFVETPEANNYGRHKLVGSSGYDYQKGVYNKEPKVEGFTVRPYYLDLPVLPGYHPTTMTYPAPKKDDVVPLYGSLYRVRGVIKRELVLDRLAEKDVPAGITLRRDTFVLTKAGHLQSTKFELVEIKPVGTTSAWSARVKVDAEPLTFDPDYRLIYETTLHKDDYFMVREFDVENPLTSKNWFGHRVLAIVPPDPKTGIIGWVELDAKRIPEAELQRMKATQARAKLTQKIARPKADDDNMPPPPPPPPPPSNARPKA